MRREHRFLNKAQISVIGVGSGGCQIINRLIEQGGLDANIVCIDSDSHLLSQMKTPVIHLTSFDPNKIPDIARVIEEIIPFFDGINLLILASTLGGTIGTNLIPSITRLAQEHNVFTISFVTLPAAFEGKGRKNIAHHGLEKLHRCANAMIVVPLDRFILVDGCSAIRAFSKAQAFICWGIKAICKLLIPGIFSIDFADLQSVLRRNGEIFIGGSCASGSNRAHQVAQRALDSPQLDLTIDGACNILLQIHTGSELFLWEIIEIITLIRHRVHTNADITLGTIIEAKMRGRMCLTILATEFEP